MLRGITENVCNVCGKTFYLSTRKTICPPCRKKQTQAENRKIKALAEAMDIRTKYEKRFDEAVSDISLQTDISKYDKAIMVAEECSELFGSKPEVIMAICLLHNKLRIIPQQKIGNYRVDFALPDIKTIIEVDGECYHNKDKDLQRDAAINYMIGQDWKIIHVPSRYTKDIEKLNKFIKKGIKGQ